ncbi:probable cytochrome P450 301a1, mitochondrial [Maniola jurtina]|uniref:probable cytochrome P450 301a1, mitochondrial n=1 Tax=Maniola jurtina TaxID=191418 RepID=UPI001E68F4B4|nr:probable cytochrome P450 301a1, mitochondrial [Maniola jurtina]
MIFNHLRLLRSSAGKNFETRFHAWKNTRMQSSLQSKPLEINTAQATSKEQSTTEITSAENDSDIFPTPRVVPVLRNRDSIVLPFDEVPGPKSLKYLSTLRNYLTEIGTQVTARFLIFGLNISTLINKRKSIRKISTLFDEYGPVVRYVNPVGADIVLLNHPSHIQKVFSLEGEHPVRSTLESLEKFRTEHKHHVYGGIYTVHGHEWVRQRSAIYSPAHNLTTHHAQGLYEICEKFTRKVYNVRNYQDEISKDLYKELHKWAFDSLGLIMFSKDLSMLDKELVNSQCDSSWMYHSLEHATEAIIKCETGMHLWKFFTTPAWYILVKYCDSLDSLIGKKVLEVEQELSNKAQNNETLSFDSLTSAMLLNEDKFKTEDIATVLMDMMLIGVNTISSSMAFLLYNIAKHQKSQRTLYNEIEGLYPNMMVENVDKLKERTPFLQACIRETLRLTPPIPILTRVLPKNITLDKYNIPRGTLIIMSMQHTSLKESNYDDATRFCPERWIKPDAEDYHAFASIPFGHGARKCLGQNIAETMMSLLAIRVLQKYKLEYHYADLNPTRSFIARPDRPLKIRFIDRL